MSIVKFDLPLKQIKYYEGSLALKEMILKFNTSLNREVLDCGAYKREKVKNITGRHLALSANCVMMVLNVVFPNLKDNFILSDQTNYGYNIKNKIDADIEEIDNALRSHMEKIFKKLTSIMNDSCKDAITTGASTSVHWDDPVEKGIVIDANDHIKHINSIIVSMFKVLR